MSDFLLASMMGLDCLEIARRTCHPVQRLPVRPRPPFGISQTCLRTVPGRRTMAVSKTMCRNGRVDSTKKFNKSHSKAR